LKHQRNFSGAVLKTTLPGRWLLIPRRASFTTLTPLLHNLAAPNNTGGNIASGAEHPAT
jgi:hypothetical protein